MYNSLVIKYILEQGVKVKQRNLMVEQKDIDLQAKKVQETLKSCYVLIGVLHQKENDKYYYLKSPVAYLQSLGEKKIVIPDGVDIPRIGTTVSALVYKTEFDTNPIVKYIEEFKW